jgi:GLPGLI family protein
MKLSYLIAFIAFITLSFTKAQNTEVLYLEIVNDPAKDGGSYHAFKTKLITNGKQSAYYLRSIDTVLANSYNGDGHTKAGSVDILRYLKDLKTGAVKYRRAIWSNNIPSIIDTVKFDYKLGSKVKQILGYDCKQAFVRWRGRYFELYYTTEIPIRDGPFKFMGLPGLILSVEDTEGVVSIQATYVNRNIDYEVATTLPVFEKPLSYKEYVKKLSTFITNVKARFESEDPGSSLSMPFREIEIMHPDYID